MSRRNVFVIVALVALFVLAAILGTFLYVSHRVAQLTAGATKPSEEQTDLGAIITRVRDLNRLETASMHVIHVSTITQSYQLIPNAIAGDEMTFFAAGDVIAGVDLSQLGPKDVRREPDGSVTVRLPPPQVLVTRVDNRESRVISRKTGILRRADIGLESRVRQYAEQGIRNEAMRRGILPLAQQNAEARLAGLLHTLGAQHVRFVETLRPAEK